MTTRLHRIVWGLGAVVVAAVVATAVLLGTHDARRDIDLGSWVEARDAWTRSVMPGARWATDELCSPGLPCTQAVRSDTLTMYQFADREDAIGAARHFAGEAYLSGWIVVRFEPGGLTAAQRREFATGLDCLHVGITEDGQEC